MPDRVYAGTRKSYWADSTAHPGSTYIWAIDGTVVQNSTKCALVHTWNSEGIFMLSLRQISPKGCSGNFQTGQVVVTRALDMKVYPNPIYGRDIKFQLTIPVNSDVVIDLFAPTGQLVARIFEGFVSGGETQTITYNRPLPQGTYSFRIKTDYLTFSSRLILITQY